MESLFRLDHKKQDEVFTMQHTHCHDHYELYYLFSGERYYLLEDRIYRILQGDLVFIPPNMVHQTAEGGTGTHERVVVYFTEPFLSDVCPDQQQRRDLLGCFSHEVKAMRVAGPRQACVEDLLRRMLREERSDRPYSLLYQKALLMQLLIFTVRNRHDQKEQYFRPESPLHRRVHKIVGYIHRNCHLSLSLETIAREFYISPYYLSRVFKQVTGLRLVEYINSVRVREAQELLRNSDLTVSQIAETVGYGSQTHFGRSFKRVTGMTAVQYRKAIGR